MMICIHIIEISISSMNIYCVLKVHEKMVGAPDPERDPHLVTLFSEQ